MINKNTENWKYLRLKLCEKEDSVEVQQRVNDRMKVRDRREDRKGRQWYTSIMKGHSWSTCEQWRLSVRKKGRDGLTDVVGDSHRWFRRERNVSSLPSCTKNTQSSTWTHPTTVLPLPVCRWGWSQESWNSGYTRPEVLTVTGMKTPPGSLMNRALLFFPHYCDWQSKRVYPTTTTEGHGSTTCDSDISRPEPWIIKLLWEDWENRWLKRKGKHYFCIFHCRTVVVYQERWCTNVISAGLFPGLSRRQA